MRRPGGLEVDTAIGTWGWPCGRCMISRSPPIGRPPAKEHAMQPSGPVPTGPGPSLFGALRGIAEEFQRISGADILSLYLYDADAQTYYAPLALGLAEEDLSGSLSDMRDQLAHYLADAAQG